MDINGKVAVVTGGASGLGLATVENFIAKGAKVVIMDVQEDKGAEAVEKFGDAVRFVKTDVTNEDDVKAALDVADELGEIRVAVNCAGVGGSKRTVGREGPYPMDHFQRVVGINLFGTFNVIRLAAERMLKHDAIDGERGVIINTASAAAFDGQIGQAAYSASKGGVVGMTLPVARDLSSMMIRVMTIAPGLFMTPLLMGAPKELLDSLGKQVPHPRRLGEPGEYALLAEQIVVNPMLNGETIRLDGAIRMAPK